MHREAREIIAAALAAGRGALSEHGSKKVVAAFGVPAAPERLVKNADEAAAAVAAFGGQTAMKACSPELKHKKEMNLVELCVSGEEQARAAYARLVELAGDTELEGVLVQPMMSGERELLLGMNRAPGFGACVTLGIGGIFAEALKDVAVRVAPLSRLDALDMMEQLRGAALLKSIRGLAAADSEKLADALVGLGELGLEFPEVEEVDVNPVIITSDGAPVAVDALVILGKAGGAA